MRINYPNTYSCDGKGCSNAFSSYLNNPGAAMIRAGWKLGGSDLNLHLCPECVDEKNIPDGFNDAPDPDAESSRDQVKRLAQAIMESGLGEPSRSEGAVDCAIRLIKELEKCRKTSKKPTRSK